MDQSSSRAAGLSRSDRESEAEEGAAPATRVKSGPRLWELGDIERNLWRNKDTPFKKRQKTPSYPFVVPDRISCRTAWRSRRRCRARAAVKAARKDPAAGLKGLCSLTFFASPRAYPDPEAGTA